MIDHAGEPITQSSNNHAIRRMTFPLAPHSARAAGDALRRLLEVELGIRPLNLLP